jgi:hypothetical protein
MKRVALLDKASELLPERLGSTSAPLVQGLLAGSLASLFSTAVLGLAGRRQAGSAAAPLNAVSHWYWGDEALGRNDTDMTHTALGYLTHHGASVFWASLYALAARKRPQLRTPAGVLGGAAVTGALACFVDFKMTPERLTPGFEHRLSTGALAAVYGAFVVGLAAGAWAMRDHYPDDQEQDGPQDDGQEPVR